MKNRINMCYLAEKIPEFCVNVPCERCIVGKMCGLKHRPLRNRAYSYRNYVLVQSPDGPYYIFDNRTDKWVVHAQYTRPLSRREAREHIQFYLKNKR